MPTGLKARLSRSSGAGCTESLECQVVLRQDEAIGKQALQSSRAPVDIEEAVAVGAVKVVVVLVVGSPPPRARAMVALESTPTPYSGPPPQV